MLKKVILIIAALLLALGAYVFLYEPELLEPLLGDRGSNTIDNPVTPSQSAPPASRPDRPKPEPPARAELELGPFSGTLYVNGVEVPEKDTLEIAGGDTVIAAYQDGDYSHELIRAEEGGRYKARLQFKKPAPVRAWESFQGGSQRTGFVAAPNRSQLLLHWSKDLGEQVLSSPITLEGVAYFSSQFHLLNAVDLATGEVLWAQGAMGSSVTPIGNDRFVFAGSDTGLFGGYARKNGKLKGEASLNSYPTSLAGISNEAFLVVTRENKVVSVKSSKNFMGRLPLKVNWSVDLPRLGNSTAVPLILPDRAVLQTEKHGLVALSLNDGSRLWPAADPTESATGTGASGDMQLAFTDPDFFMTPTPGGDGDVLYAVQADKLAAVRAQDGQTLWERTLSYRPSSALSLAYDTLYIGGADGRIHAHSILEGVPVFEVRVSEKAIFAAPVLFGDKLLVATGEGMLKLLNCFSGTVLFTDDTLAGSAINSTPAPSGDYILAINKKGRMACYR